MNVAPRLRATVVVAFAVCLFLGMMITPPSGDGAAALLQSLRDHSRRAYLTGLFRFLTSLLVGPALLVLASSIRRGGARLVRVAAGSLYVASFAGVAVFTQMILLTGVLAPMPDRVVALAVAEAIEASPLSLISAIVYLVGMLVGFLLLGLSLWRARVGRLVAVAVALGLLLHIAGGDWIVTSLTGALVLCGGLAVAGLRIMRRPEGWQHSPLSSS